MERNGMNLSRVEKYGINLEKLDIQMASKIISAKKGNN